MFYKYNEEEKVIFHAYRWDLMYTIVEGEISRRDLIEQWPISEGGFYSHMTALLKAGVVESRKEFKNGKSTTYYQATDKGKCAFITVGEKLYLDKKIKK